jgi:hypothetical protein
MKVTPDVIRDLIPLVKDGVASEDSVRLVEAYMEQDDQLKTEYHLDPAASADQPQPNDIRLMKAIRRSVMVTQAAILLIGTAIGIAMTNSFGMFYNLLLMPFIGAVTVFTFKSVHKLYAPLVVFAASYIWQMAGSLRQGLSLSLSAQAPLLYSLIYAGLVMIGMIIGFLLKFAFGKEKREHGEDKEKA